MAAIVAAAQELVAAQGARLTVLALERGLAERRCAPIPHSALDWLRAHLLHEAAADADGRGRGPQAMAVVLDGELHEVEPTVAGDADPGADAQPATADDQPPAGLQPDQITETEPAPGGEGGPTGGGTLALVATSPTAAEPAPAAELIPAPLPATAIPMRFGGLALGLPALQSLLDPLQAYLHQAWGQRPWRYAPQALLSAFILYLLMGFKNPERVKSAPHLAFGPLLGHRRGPACITLRRRLPGMARIAEVVDGLQRVLAITYLKLGWVEPGYWLADGHFSPFMPMFGLCRSRERRAWG